jgi:two-component system response regulator DesR
MRSSDRNSSGPGECRCSWLADLGGGTQAGTGDEAIATVRRHQPDVVILDVAMPGRDGAEVSRWVSDNAPGTQCVFLTRHARPSVLRRALMAGAAGFVTKSAPATMLAEVIRRVHRGGRYVDPDLAMTALMAERCPLTGRELEVLSAVETGSTGADIARIVHLSPGTVRNYLSSAMQKLGAGTRMEAVKRARDRGWL